MMDFKEVFDSDDVELFEQCCMTQSERKKIAERVQWLINKSEQDIEINSTNRTGEDKWKLSYCQVPKTTIHTEQAELNNIEYLQGIFVKLYRELTDMDKDVGMLALSEKLSTLADNMGFTEEARELTIEHTKVQSALLNLKFALCGGTHGLRIVGSQAEGTGKQNRDTDMDILEFNHLISVYLSSQNPKTTWPYLCMIEDKITPAGYIKLQLFYKGHSVNKHNVTDYESLFPHKLIVDKSRVFLGNELTNDFSELAEHYEGENHGPATTFEGNETNGSVDHVQTYICKSLPDSVMPWFNRKRRYGWPNEEILKLFKQMGCVVVAIGHKNSPEQNLQWRLSFTNQEMYLMHNLNMTQYKCYVILKHFRTTSIKEFFSDSLCSYHLKTVLFYTIENSKPSIWQPKYLAFVILKCLHTLRQWVSEMNFPNYFIPQENMFVTKFNLEEKEELTNFLSLQFDDQYYLRFLLHMCEYEIPCKMEWLLYFSRLRKASLEELNLEFGDSIRKKGYPNILGIKNIIQCLTIFTGNNESALCPTMREYTVFPELLIVVFFMRYAGTYDGRRVQPFLYEMPNFEDIYAILINSSALRSAFGHVQRFLHCKIASYVMLGYSRLTTQDSDMLFDFVNDHVQKAGIAHAVNTRLKQASCIYADGNHELVDVILEKVAVKELNETELPLFCFHSIACKEDTGVSSTYSFVMKKLDKVVRNVKPHQLSLDYLTDITHTCLSFDSIETPMIPRPLQYEGHKTFGAPVNLDMSIFLRLIIIDPIIYLFYLQYINKEKLDDKPGMSSVLRRLGNIMLDNLRGWKIQHMDTALNCLGHIYVTKGWRRLAIRCFRKSLEVEPLYNSAKWHLMFLLFG